MYILYKQPIQLETLYIVQYLHSRGIHLLPSMIVERNYPANVTELPTIVYEQIQYNGLDQVVSLYESISGIDNLLEKSKEFKKQNPTYTIHYH